MSRPDLPLPDAEREIEPMLSKSMEIVPRRHTLDQLVDMPHDVLAVHAQRLEGQLEGAQRLNSSLARLQLAREEEMAREVSTDSLTGLLNRRALYERVEDLIRNGEGEFALVFADLKLFKEINDTYGHQYGDHILQKTAERLLSCFREDDNIMHDVARMGGDEFAVLFDLAPRKDSELTEKQRVLAVTERMKSDISDMAEEEGITEMGFDIHIGYAIYKDGDSIATMVQRADEMMYEDKRAGREPLNEEQLAWLRSGREILRQAGMRIPEHILALLDDREAATPASDTE